MIQFKRFRPAHCNIETLNGNIRIVELQPLCCGLGLSSLTLSCNTILLLFRFLGFKIWSARCMIAEAYVYIKGLQIFFIVFFFLLLLFYKCFSISPLFLDITVFERPLDWNSSFLWLGFDLKAPFCSNTFQESFQ